MHAHNQNFVQTIAMNITKIALLVYKWGETNRIRIGCDFGLISPASMVCNMFKITKTDLKKKV